MRGALPPLAVAALAALAACDRDARARGEPEPGPAAAPHGGVEAGAGAAELARLRGALAGRDEEIGRMRDELARARERAGDLHAELAREREERLQREQEWMEYNRALAAFDLDRIGLDLSFPVDTFGPEPPPEPPAGEPAPDPVAERSAAIHRSLGNLLRLAGVYDLDPIELGRLSEDGWIGPVVFRWLDHRGRLAGSLSAERMRLVSSGAAHTVTLVFEEGHESRGGERRPFRSGAGEEGSELSPGVRRVVLPGVDPEPWRESMPELFSRDPEHGLVDDGLWSASRLVVDVNALLREDAAGGYLQLRRIGGVAGEVLFDVALSSFDRDGRLERMLLAERLRIEPLSSGVRLVLEEGASLRGDTTIPFLDGRMRIVLPRADVERWRAAGVPGISAPPEPADAPSAPRR